MTATTGKEGDAALEEPAPGGQPAPGVFTNILAVCGLDDGDRHMLETAARVAGASGAALTLLAVVEPPDEIERIAEATGLAPAAVRQRLADEQRARLERLADDCGLDRAPELAVRIGKPFIEIIRHVLENGCDLVIKTAEELTGVSRYLFASTDQHLLRKCPCPVWLRRDRAVKPIHCVLAAVDVDMAMASEPETMAGLNRHIVDAAAGIAAIDGAVVHVLHAWDAPGEGLVRMWSGEPDREKAARRYVEDLQSMHWRALEKMVGAARQGIPQTANGVRFVAAAERGQARSVIPEQVRALGADLLVMGTVARTRVPGFIIGNTAEDVLNSVDCPVVTVKPPNYVSPVKALMS